MLAAKIGGKPPDVARYFFDIDGMPPDQDGVEVAELATVRSQAITAAGETLRDLGGALPNGEWNMRVTDEARQRVLTLHFRAIEH